MSEIDRQLHEAMGLCIHKLKSHEFIRVCTKCDDRFPIGTWDDELIPSYSTDPVAYMKVLIPWAMNEKWWLKFMYWLGGKYGGAILNIMLNPERGSAAIAEYLEGK